MTPARRIDPGTTYLVTARTVHRVFAFRPGERFNELFRYLFAYALSEYGVLAHGLTVQSNHYHAVVTDPFGVLPAMLQEFHSLLARGLNADHGTTGSVLERNNVDLKPLLDEGALVVALAYTAANPVEAGCVERGGDWPGIRTSAKSLGKEATEVDRPAWLFAKRSTGEYDGKLPERVTFRLDLPPGIAPERRGKFVHEVMVATFETEAAARAEKAAKGQRFLGAAACLAVNPERVATAYEPHGPGTGPSPVLATDKARLAAALVDLYAFRDAYAEARAVWANGDHTVLFPRGTWLLARYHAARVVGHADSPPG